eukprot:scaffold319054_cov30-Tisochrysis_lutea.AAC.1
MSACCQSLSSSSISCAGGARCWPFARSLSVQPSSTSGTARKDPGGSSSGDSTTSAVPWYSSSSLAFSFQVTRMRSPEERREAEDEREREE